MMLVQKVKDRVRTFLESHIPALWFKKPSFSQEGEDLILLSFLNTELTKKGFYIDIGAHHPFRFSNTALLYKKGWKGINIEPTPSLMSAFRRHRKRDKNLNFGISDHAGEITFYEFNEPAINTFDQSIAISKNQIPQYHIVKETTIDVKPLSAILDEYLETNQIINVMTIDTEGFDFKVLKSNDWLKYKPIFVLIEHDIDFNNLKNDEIYSYLTDLNYEIKARTHRTSIFRINNKNNP